MLLFSSAGLAETSDYRIGVYARTHHLTVSNQNDDHPMIQVEYQRRWVAGVYQNSGRAWSWYFARRWQSDENLKPYVELGWSSNYVPGRLLKTIRYGIELTPNTDLVVMPAFKDLNSWQITQPAVVVGVLLKF